MLPKRIDTPNRVGDKSGQALLAQLVQHSNYLQLTSHGSRFWPWQGHTSLNIWVVHVHFMEVTVKETLTVNRSGV